MYSCLHVNLFRLCIEDNQACTENCNSFDLPVYLEIAAALPVKLFYSLKKNLKGGQRNCLSSVDCLCGSATHRPSETWWCFWSDLNWFCIVHMLSTQYLCDQLVTSTAHICTRSGFTYVTKAWKIKAHSHRKSHC